MIANPTATTTLSTILCFFFFNDTATTEIYTLSLHDALPISLRYTCRSHEQTHKMTPMDQYQPSLFAETLPAPRPDRKSTRLNSSHSQISYAVFCLKKKKKILSNITGNN